MDTNILKLPFQEGNSRCFTIGGRTWCWDVVVVVNDGEEEGEEDEDFEDEDGDDGVGGDGGEEAQHWQTGNVVWGWLVAVVGKTDGK